MGRLKRLPSRHKYGAKLLFQFRATEGFSRKPRTCEERVVVFTAESPEDALAKAKRRGKRREFSYPNSDGDTVHFEFLGVRELDDLSNLHRGEVWYDIAEYVINKKTLARLIPEDSALAAFRK